MPSEALRRIPEHKSAITIQVMNNQELGDTQSQSDLTNPSYFWIPVNNSTPLLPSVPPPPPYLPTTPAYDNRYDCLDRRNVSTLWPSISDPSTYATDTYNQTLNTPTTLLRNPYGYRNIMQESMETNLPNSGGFPYRPNYTIANNFQLNLLPPPSMWGVQHQNNSNPSGTDSSHNSLSGREYLENAPIPQMSNSPCLIPGDDLSDQSSNGDDVPESLAQVGDAVLTTLVEELSIYNNYTQSEMNNVHANGEQNERIPASFLDAIHRTRAFFEDSNVETDQTDDDERDDTNDEEVERQDNNNETEETEESFVRRELSSGDQYIHQDLKAMDAHFTKYYPRLRDSSARVLEGAPDEDIEKAALFHTLLNYYRSNGLPTDRIAPLVVWYEKISDACANQMTCPLSSFSSDPHRKVLTAMSSQNYEHVVRYRLIAGRSFAVPRKFSMKKELFEFFQTHSNYHTGFFDNCYIRGNDYPSFFRQTLQRKRTQEQRDIPKLSEERVEELVEEFEYMNSIIIIFRKATKKLGVQADRRIQQIREGSLAESFMEDTNVEVNTAEVTHVSQDISIDLDSSNLDSSVSFDDSFNDHVVTGLTEESHQVVVSGYTVHGDTDLEDVLDSDGEDEDVYNSDDDLESDGDDNDQEEDETFDVSTERLHNYIINDSLDARLCKGVCNEIRRAATEFSIDRWLGFTGHYTWTAKKCSKWVMEKWSSIGSSRVFDYCKCFQTAYIRENSSLTQCPHCDLSRKEAYQCHYHSVRGFLGSIFLNDALMADIEKKRGKRDPTKLNSFVDGKLFGGSHTNRSEISEPYFTFHLAFGADGCNLLNKKKLSMNAQILSILDLPDAVQKTRKYTWIPLVYPSQKNNPGYNAEMCKILFQDMQDLHLNGMVIRKGGVDYRIFINLCSLTGVLLLATLLLLHLFLKGHRLRVCFHAYSAR